MKTHHKEKIIVIELEIRSKRIYNCHEFLSLSSACDIEIVKNLPFKQNDIKNATFISSGKLEIIKQYIEANPPIDAVLINHPLSPTQQKNMETALCCTVLDRNDVILQIFAERAQSYEGKLQVELAQLTRLSTRLVRFWTHLERQKGGIGLRGPGETQLETDKRLIHVRIKQLKQKIQKIQNRRNLQRHNRSKHQTPVVSLVGYTSAGKTTLFNQLTKQSNYADQMFFSTLDTNVKKIQHKQLQHILLSDTVGFIANLPAELVLAFRSTLEEIKNSQLILHVVDQSHPEHLAQIKHVQDTMHEINADHIPTIIVMNKIDQIKKDTLHPLPDQENTAQISAKNGDGIDALLEQVQQQINGPYQMIEMDIEDTEGTLTNQLHQCATIIKHTHQNTHQTIQMSITTQKLAEIMRQYPSKIKQLQHIP